MIGWSCPTSVLYETIPARWKGKGDSSNEQLNELKDPEYVPWRFQQLAFGGQISKMGYSRMCLTMGDYDGDLSNKI